ncbi:MAG: isocitrate lyase/phosphoenolpyruvate mutase family protein [Pseudomonadota bacterium]
MSATNDIGTIFRDLHRPGDPFILMNVWDQGGAKVAAALGAQALATSSAAHAFTLGKPDMGHVTRDEALTHAQDLIAATPLPVSGDFENGFGDSPEDVAETIRLAGEIGLAGCSIEDIDMATGGAYDFDLAVERIRVASAAARSLGPDFVLVARADGIMNRVYDADEAVRRLQAFDTAGADCLYAPMPRSLDDLKQLIGASTKPFNALAAGKFAKSTRSEFAALGVARISLGSSLARVTHHIMIETAKKILKDGDFSDFLTASSFDNVDALIGGPTNEPS